jgi:hypothetical protein
VARKQPIDYIGIVLILLEHLARCLIETPGVEIQFEFLGHFLYSPQTLLTTLRLS